MTTTESQEQPRTVTEDSLEDRIAEHRARVTVVGGGYTGLPLAILAAEAGFQTQVYDVDQDRVDSIKHGNSYLSDVSSERIRALIDKETLSATTDAEDLSTSDVFLICVPTPLGPSREPDLQHVDRAAREVAESLGGDQLVVLESTTYPGTTEEVLLPAFEHQGLQPGDDVSLAYSPERIDPGRDRSMSQVPKVVGGLTEACTERASAFFEAIFAEVVPVSSPRVGEATKLLENVYRSVNIALVNELKILFERMDVDIWEVIEAAKTKPYGFTPFYPGPGLGGHCIPIDPFYLAWKAREHGTNARFVELAGEINTAMPDYVLQRLSWGLNEHGKPVRGSDIVVVGVAYKPDVSDTRESPALDLLERLLDLGAEVTYHDPHVPQITINSFDDLITLESAPLTDERLGDADAVLIVTDHSAVDHDRIAERAPLVVDTRHAISEPGENVVKS